VDSVRRQFPIPELQTKYLKEVLLTLNAQPQETTREIREWHHFSKSRHKKAVITDHFALVEYKRYNTFRTLSQDFLGLANTLFQAFEDLQIKRLGLRYIDQIEIDERSPTEWSQYLRPELLSIFKLADDPHTITRAFHVLEILHDDESRVRFQYGMPNPDFPARIKRKHFTLDCDVYSTLLLDKSQLESSLSRFHERARDAFEQVITDRLRQKMGAVYD
jgi:uncharacterized protein (TIGR04255 family)